jgi:hypothetical protein
MDRGKLAVRFLVAGLVVTALLWMLGTVALVRWIAELL